jgi:hypothetical protein
VVESPPGTYPGGFLPSQYPETQSLPNAKQFLSELVDMQFQDIRVLLRLPDPQIAPNVGCNFTAAAMLTNLISGFSVWFFHTPYARGKIEKEERKRKQGLSKRRFLGFVRAYYPRQLHEPTVATIATACMPRETCSRTTSASTTRRGAREQKTTRGGRSSRLRSR